MPNIRVDISYTIADGSEVVFSAPCNCSEVEGLKVYHPDGEKVFTFKDAHGADLTGIGELFAAGALVKAILDVTNAHAYIQNADTNAYLESRFSRIEAAIGAGGGGSGDLSSYPTKTQVQEMIDTAISNIPVYSGEVEDV